MITTGQLRIFAKDFIRKISRPDIVQDDDIRYLKSGNGVFPRKFVWYGEVDNRTFKETPYLPDDTFILFDVLEEKTKANEVIGGKIYSQLPFKMIINVYGNNCEDEVQYMLAAIHRYDVKYWMQRNGITMTRETEDFQVLDGRENATWWKRRRFEIMFNTQQQIDYYIDDDKIDDIERIPKNVVIIKE